MTFLCTNNCIVVTLYVRIIVDWIHFYVRIIVAKLHFFARITKFSGIIFYYEKFRNDFQLWCCDKNNFDFFVFKKNNPYLCSAVEMTATYWWKCNAHSCQWITTSAANWNKQKAPSFGLDICFLHIPAKGVSCFSDLRQFAGLWWTYWQSWRRPNRLTLSFLCHYIDRNCLFF